MCKDKVAIVTGGGRGIGSAMTLGLAQAGAAVVERRGPEPHVGPRVLDFGMSEHLHVEEPAFAPLVPINVKREADAVDGAYKNFVLNRVNDHCVRVAVMVGEYPWHHHPRSDETFLVVEGVFEIDLDGGRTVILQPGELFTIPAGVRHRTRAKARTVNLCFENVDAYTDVVFS